MASKKFHFVSAANATPVQICSAGGVNVNGWNINCTNAAARYVKLYDTDVAPTVGTTTPSLTIQAPALGTITGNVNQDSLNVSFAKGLWIAITNLAADSDTTAPGAGDVIANIFFE
jgi:hypothetical protein